MQSWYYRFNKGVVYSEQQYANAAHHNPETDNYVLLGRFSNRGVATAFAKECLAIHVKPFAERTDAEIMKLMNFYAIHEKVIGTSAHEFFRTTEEQYRDMMSAHKHNTFIFDMELMENDDMESMKGYLCATNTLVERMKTIVSKERAPFEMESVDDINFYADYNPRTGIIKVTGAYVYTTYDETSYGLMDTRGSFELPISRDEVAILIDKLEAYCMGRNGLSCLGFVNEARGYYYLPPLVQRKAHDGLYSMIQNAEKKTEPAGRTFPEKATAPERY